MYTIKGIFRRYANVHMKMSCVSREILPGL